MSRGPSRSRAQCGSRDQRRASAGPHTAWSDHARFRALESPLIKRHRGKVLLSLSTKPTSDWPFHILELVSFPSIEHYQALMVDPDYAPETPIGNAMATTYTPDLNVVTAKLK